MNAWSTKESKDRGTSHERGTRLSHRVHSPTKGLEAPSWLVSLCLHIALFLILAIVFRPFFRGTGGSQERTIGVAFVQEVSEGEENDSAAGGVPDSAAGGAASSGAILSAQAIAGLKPPLDTNATLSELTGGGEAAAPSADSLGGSGNAIGPGAGGTGSKGGKKGGKLSEVNFYDVAGVGNSFVFVIDRSDSMNEHEKAPLRAVKREVIKSLEGLKSSNQFQIIFYNDQPFSFQSKVSGGRGLVSGQDSERKRAIDFVSNVRAFGSTEHLAALKMGIRFNPDVIFFLTDAEEPRLSATDLRVLVDECAGNTTIHTVEFGVGPNPARGRWIEALADMTQGKYRYIDVTQLEK